MNKTQSEEGQYRDDNPWEEGWDKMGEEENAADFILIC